MREVSARFFGAVVICGLAGLFGPNVALAGLEEGVRAYEQGDFAMAIKEWLPVAEKGDRNALFNLGQVYRMGKGVPRNFDTAEYYYQEAAKRGHSAAQGNLGTLYYFGKADGKPQIDKALKWWRLAARNGDPRSQYMMGILYFNGKFVERDMVTAYGWMTLASQSRLKEAVESESKIGGFLSPKERAAGKQLAQTLIKGDASKNEARADTSVPKVNGTETTGSGRVAEAVVAPIPAPVKAPVPAKAPPPPPVKAPAPSPAPHPATPVVTEAKPAPVQAAAPPSSDSAAFRIQLGAYKSRDAAETTWAGLQRSHQAILGSLNLVVTEADLGSKGIFYRLQAGAFATSREALMLCQKLKAQKQDCMVAKAAP